MDAALNIVLDAAIALVLIIFAVRGAKRGFVITIASLLTVVLALVGAGLAVKLLSPRVAESLLPSIEEQILPAAGDSEVLDFGELTVFGVRVSDFALGQELSDNAEEAARELSASIADSVADCLVGVAAFVVLMLVIKLVAHLLDLVFKLPVLNGLNRFFGVIAGLLVGGLFVMLVVTVLSLFTGLIPAETAENTILFAFFKKLCPISF